MNDDELARLTSRRVAEAAKDATTLAAQIEPLLPLYSAVRDCLTGIDDDTMNPQRRAMIHQAVAGGGGDRAATALVVARLFQGTTFGLLRWQVYELLARGCVAKCAGDSRAAVTLFEQAFCTMKLEGFVADTPAEIVVMEMQAIGALPKVFVSK